MPQRPPRHVGSNKLLCARTAISLAAQRGHLQSTMLLLEHRAQPQTADATGSTAVGWAAKMGQKPVAPGQKKLQGWEVPGVGGLMFQGTTASG